MIVDELFYVTQNFGVTPMRRRGHFGQKIAASFIDCGWLRVEDKWDSKQSLDEG